ncbi:MAG: MFS transporter [Thermoplasmata archaeon]
MYKYGFSGLDRRIWYLGITRFIRSMGRVSSFIFLPLIFVLIYNVSYLVTGIFLGFATLIMSVVQYYSGKWTDNVGRRIFLILIPFPVAAVYFLMFFFIFIKFNFILVVIVWYLSIIINAIQFPAIQASVADITSEYERLSAYTLIRIMVNIGAAVGPLVGAIIAQFNFSYIFLFASISSLIEGIILLIYYKETYFPGNEDKEKFSLGILKKDKFFLFFIIIGLVLGFALRQNGPALTLYAFNIENLKIIDIGYIYSLNGILVIALQMPFLKLMSRYSTPVFWRGISSIIYALGFFILAFSTNLILILLVMTIFTVGEDFMAPTTQTIITTIAPSNLRGTYIGTYNFFTSFGRFFGSIIGLYYLYILRSIPYLFWVYIALITAISGSFYFFLNSLFKKKEINNEIKYVKP